MQEYEKFSGKARKNKKKFTEETANLLTMTMIQRGLNPRKISYTLKMDIRDITHALTRNTNRGVTVEKLLKIAKHLGLENPELEERGPATNYAKKKVKETLEEPPVTSFPAANDEVWTTKDGTKIPIAEMDVEHLRNALRLVVRNQNKLKYMASTHCLRSTERKHGLDQVEGANPSDYYKESDKWRSFPEGLGADDIMSF
tara:strand:+ start:2174 stop:2773 length:600 start_codon:yes stop_codon:yes gene_type:complete